MKALLLLITYCLVLLPLTGHAADESYGYPVPGSYEATILGTPTALMPKFPAKIHMKQILVEVLRGRERPPIFFWDEGLRCNFAFQESRAPLVFLIAGTGASGVSHMLITMTKAFYEAGYHVITLPSPSNANFIISASKDCVPGDLQEDSRDIYTAMESVWNKVKGEVEVSDFNLVGASLGATQAAFVAKLDEERKVFNFRKVLMINPSVSLYNSIGKIEGMLKNIPGGAKKEGAFFNRMLAKFGSYYRYGNFAGLNDDFIYSIYQEKLFSQAETAGLIGFAYRINLAGMIFASDVMNGGGYVVPKNRILKVSDSLFEYFLVSSHLSFYDYFNEYFYPHFQKVRPGISKEQLVASESLRSIGGYLAASTKFGVITNENDFILAPDELLFLKELFGDRAKVYPRGGHLGNAEYKENLDYMVGFFGKQGGKP